MLPGGGSLYYLQYRTTLVATITLKMRGVGVFDLVKGLQKNQLMKDVVAEIDHDEN